MSFLQQFFTSNDIEVEFSTEEKYFIQHDCSSDSNSIRVFIYVRKGKQLLSLYSRLFSKNISAIHYLNFVKKFMSTPSYRQNYLIDGYTHWEEKIHTNSSAVHPQCEKQISELNQKEKVKFNDLVPLKTFGKDIFSPMKIDKLKKLVSSEDFAFLFSESENELILLSSLRWVARGLKSQHALYKARVDAEIEKNKQESQSM